MGLSCVDVVVVLVLVTLTKETHGRVSGFYADDDITGQTVLVDVLPGGPNRRAIKREILNVLGLDRRPRPSNKAKDNSAPHFMIDLYKTLVEVEEEQEEEEDNIVQKRKDRRRGGEGGGRDWDDGTSGRRRRGGKANLGNFTLPELERQVTDADVIMSFKNIAAASSEKIRHNADHHLNFDLRQAPLDEELTGAELRLFKNAVTSPSRFFRIALYSLVKDNVDSSISTRFETATKVIAGYKGWVDVNVTALTQLWSVFPSDNHGLYLTVTDDQGVEVRPKEAGMVGRRGDNQPFLVAFFKANSNVIKRRRVRSTKRRRNADVSFNDAASAPTWDPYGQKFARSVTHRPCQRRSLFVSFEELGWQGWIISPNGYSAFYCDGECSFPLNVHMNATNHAIVQTLVHLMSPQEIPQPSCAPTRLTAVSLLYFDDDYNVILKKYRNMVARSCGCH